MRVLFFTDNLNAGGKERRLTELMRALSATKHDIEFELVLMSKDIHYKEVFDYGIKIHFLIRESRKDLRIFQKLYNLCKDYKPDIIHCWDSMTAIYCAPVCKLLGIKMINGMITNAPQGCLIFNKHWLRSKFAFPFSDIIVGNSQAGLKAYNAPVKRSIVIHNGFDFDRTENLLSKSLVKEQLNINTDNVVGMVATFSEYKDYKSYYRAAQLILGKRKDITFLAIGNETDSDASMSLVDKQYFEYFRFLGKRSGIESYINLMDICILSTFSEGLSNSVIEYMALGKPVIATSGGGTNELVIDQNTGFLINPSSPEELAEKIEILLDNPELRTKMGLAGKSRILNEFSIDQMVMKYINLYQTILEA